MGFVSYRVFVVAKGTFFHVAGGMITTTSPCWEIVLLTTIWIGICVLPFQIASAEISVQDAMWNTPSDKDFEGLPTRQDIAVKLDNLHLKVGAEVGVQKGKFARHTLEMWSSCQKYFLIDLWKHQTNYVDVANVDDMRQEKLYRESLRNTLPWKNKVTVLKMSSTEAAAKLPKESLDYVYLDARHDYCGVVEDLHSFWGKVKPGGILAGHDFHSAAEVRAISPKQDWSVCGNGTVHPGAVKGAVVEFAYARNLTVHVTGEKQWPSWIILKQMRSADKVESLMVSPWSSSPSIIHLSILCKSSIRKTDTFRRVRMFLNSLMLHRGEISASEIILHIFSDDDCKKELITWFPLFFTGNSVVWYSLAEIEAARATLMPLSRGMQGSHHAGATLLDKLFLPMAVHSRFPLLKMLLFLDIDQIILSPIKKLYDYAYSLRTAKSNLQMAATCANDSMRIQQYGCKIKVGTSSLCHNTTYCITGTIAHYLDNYEAETKFTTEIQKIVKDIVSALGSIRTGHQEVFNVLFNKYGSGEFGVLPASWGCLVKDMEYNTSWSIQWGIDGCNSLHFAGGLDFKKKGKLHNLVSLVEEYSNLPPSITFGRVVQNSFEVKAQKDLS